MVPISRSRRESWISIAYGRRQISKSSIEKEYHQIGTVPTCYLASGQISASPVLAVYKRALASSCLLRVLDISLHSHLDSSIPLRSPFKTH